MAAAAAAAVVVVGTCRRWADGIVVHAAVGTAPHGLQQRRPSAHTEVAAGIAVVAAAAAKENSWLKCCIAGSAAVAEVRMRQAAQYQNCFVVALGVAHR